MSGVQETLKWRNEKTSESEKEIGEIIRGNRFINKNFRPKLKHFVSSKKTDKSWTMIKSSL